MRALVLIVVVACGGGRARVPDDLDDDLVRRREATREVYTLWWNGARIGDVEEEVTRDGDGVRLVRRERVQVMRGDRLAATRLVLTIDADAELVAREVRLESWTDSGATTATAARRRGDWLIRIAGEPDRRVDGAAVPAELVPLVVARDGAFEGVVLLAGRGFATARLTADRERATLEVPGGRLVTELTLDRDGTVLRAAGADGVVAVRATAADVAAPFEPPEVVDATAIPVRGTPAEGARRLHLALAPVDRALPPAIPGQTVAADGDRWGAILDATLPGALRPGEGSADRADEIVELVRVVDLRLEEDLALTATTMADARAATRGDCTTHALLFAALAADAAIEVQLVTGFRYAGGRLVRHRWALAWTGAAWMAVDPTHGEAPIRSFLLGLAVHGPRADEVALADELAFAGTGGARAKVQP